MAHWGPSQKKIAFLADASAKALAQPLAVSGQDFIIFSHAPLGILNPHHLMYSLKKTKSGTGEPIVRYVLYLRNVGPSKNTNLNRELEGLN